MTDKVVVEAETKEEAIRLIRENSDFVDVLDTVDEERDEIDIKDYIDEQYHHFINDSKPYQGIIMTKS